jgi:outer membrane immunogenic protein
MNSVLTHAADTPSIQRTRATKGIWTSSIAALLALTSSGVFAADAPAVRTPAAVPRAAVAPAFLPMPIPFYNWTGFYIGGNLGFAREASTLTDNRFDVVFDKVRSGFIAGGQIGYNWQISPQFVLGVEWMFDGTNISSDTDTATVRDPTGHLVTLQGNTKVDWISTLAARFGWAAYNWLFYAKAGTGWVHDTATVADSTDGITVSAADTRGGWLLGAGIEYGFTPNWSVRVEWDHLGLADVTRPGFINPVVPVDTVTFSRHFDLLTLGLNYRF